MATVTRFEDLDIWKNGMELCVEIYNLTNQNIFSKDFELKNQIRRTAISVPSNISEGFERDSTNQFIYFLNISKGSCGELRTQLKIANMLLYISDEEYNDLNERCNSTSKQIAGLMRYLKTAKLPNKGITQIADLSASHQKPSNL